MSDQPPQQFVAYPRPGLAVEDPAKLQLLADGLGGLSKVIGYYILAAVAWFLTVSTLVLTSNAMPSVGLLGIVITVFAMGFTGGYVAMIGEGLGWTKGWTIVARILMALNFLFCGCIGFLVIQQIVAKELKKYNVRLGFVGVNKQDLEQALARLQPIASINVGPNPPAM